MCPKLLPTVRPSTQADAVDLAPLMRPEDAQEVFSASGKSPLGALMAGLRESETCLTVEYDGKPAAMFGVVPGNIRDTALGYVWLLGSPAIEDFARDFLRESKDRLKELGEGYDVLTNYVDCRNQAHLRWLEWLGFEFGAVDEKYGIEQVPFIRVTKYV